jgi:hypothetical protein
MKYQRRLASIALLAVLSGTAALGVACTDDSAKEERAALEQAVAAEQARARALESELASTSKTVTALQQEAQSHQVAMQEEAKESANLSPVLLLKREQALPTPRPAATPAPPGYVAPPPRTAPAEYKQPVDFVFYVENLTGSAVTDFGTQWSEGCIQNAIYPRESKLVWRVEIVDVKTGLRVMPEDGSLSVRLPHGEEKAFRFSQRGGGRTEGAPWQWASAWVVPADYPLGTLNYELVLTMKDGRTASWRMPYSGSPLTIVE